MTAAEKLLEQEKSRRSAHYFIFDSKHLVTKNEHSQVNPVAPFPDLPYLRVMLDCLLVSGRYLKAEEAVWAKGAGIDREYLGKLWEHGAFLSEKSRQILATWMVTAYLLWRAKYHPYQLVLVQSKREDDAFNLVFNKEPTVARMSFMEVSLPAHLRTVEFPRGATAGHLHFPNGSHVWGIPEGGDVIRSNTPSALFSDEAAFQPEFNAAYTAALPAINGGGQYIAISSAEPGAFCDLLEAGG